MDGLELDHIDRINQSYAALKAKCDAEQEPNPNISEYVCPQCIGGDHDHCITVVNGDFCSCWCPWMNEPQEAE